jgi:hypothetical protein
MLGRGDGLGQGEAHLVSRYGENLTANVDRTVLRRESVTDSKAKHFLICVICEICG